MTQTPQHLELYIDVDGEIIASRPKCQTDVSAWHIKLYVSLLDVVVLEKTAIFIDATIGLFKFKVSPDNDGLVAGTCYDWKIKRTDIGSRDVLAAGTVLIKE